MFISYRSLATSSACKFFVRLATALLLLSVCTVNAQQNTSNVNGNAGSANGTANNNANANANTNVNANRNQNDNQNGNANSSSNANTIEVRRDRIADSAWFPIVITFMFAAVLIPFTLLIMRSIMFSRSTFNSPLGLPEGSLRAILAFMLVVFLGFFVYASVLSFSDFKPPELLLGIVATVVGFYFGSRTGEDRGTSASRTGFVHGDVTDNIGTPASGANVDLSQSGSKKFTQKADVKGKYKFDNIPAGDYDIQASLQGRGSSDPTKVKVTAGALQTVDLKLK